MRAKVQSPLADTAAGARAEAVLRACVHCGMCNAVCPTFQLTGDELDGPRGRIYLMKGALEGERIGRETLLHLDRCLECRACETACPSGVEYHRLLDVGRPFVEEVAARPVSQRLWRGLIRWVSTDSARFAAVLRLGRTFGPLLPATIRGKLAIRKTPSVATLTTSPLPPHEAQGRYALLAGCVQAAAAPQFNDAAKRVFRKAGLALSDTPAVRCCGAVSFHLDAPDEAKVHARRNIDVWLAEIDAGAQGVMVTASGCAAFIKDYPDLLADDPAYAEKARRIADTVCDPVEALEAAPPSPVRPPAAPKIAVHDPCTLRNGLKLAGRVEALLARLGFEPQPVRDQHLCCGSAGPYALTQPGFANALRAQKLEALTESAPAAIVTANIGCWMHLSETSPVPVRHWLEAVDDIT
jgi:glycolate oxidase iron-sulfur subunit